MATKIQSRVRTEFISEKYHGYILHLCLLCWLVRGWWWYYADDPRPDTDLLLPRTPRCHPSPRTQLYIFIFIFSASPPVCSSYWQVRLGQRVHVSGWHGPQQRPVETMEPVFPRSSSVPGARWRGWPLLDTTVCCLGLVWSPANYDLYPLMSGYSSACVAQNLDRAGGISIPSCRAPNNVYKLQATSYKLILAVCDPFIWALSGLLPPWTLRM